MLGFAGRASAAPAVADLRVLTDSATFEPGRSYVTDTVKIRTSPDADCFGPPGGSGDVVTVPGPTGLGIVRSALVTRETLRPLLVTDQFGFGLGVCAIGGRESSGSEFWYLKVNHVGAQVAGDQLKLSGGEKVLWYLTPGFPPPPELALTAPPRAKPNVPFQVTVRSYADDGTAAPAVGATVTGGAGPTDAAGHTMVSLPKSASLMATHIADIPSNRVPVCVNADLPKCPSRFGKEIVGTKRADSIHGTRGWDTIRALAGNDRINVLGGGRDRVFCGGGQDRVRAGSNDRLSRCEVVIHH
jgi:Ca2+-binding RTX toxin-like protein